MAEQPHPVREFHKGHNQTALLDENIRGGADYADIIRFLRNSRIGFAISESIHLVRAYIDDFWRTARVVNDTIEATVSENSIVITEAVVRAALRFGDLDYGSTCYVRQIRERGVRSFGYAGSFDKKEISKPMFLGQWRFFFHVLMQCLSPRKSGTDTMSNDLVSGMIGLPYNQPYNFSLMIFQALKQQIGLKANDKRLMLLYPRFLCIIFRHLLPNLSFEGTLLAYGGKPMGNRIFKDCAKINESKRTDARPVLTPLCGAILHDNYNPEADLQWLNIRDGLDHLFVGDTQEPVVVQPQVDLQQPPAVIQEPEPVQEPVISESVTVTSIQAAVAVETDDEILELDAALDAGPSSRAVDKGKRPMEDAVVDELLDDMPTEKEYLMAVPKELQNCIRPHESRSLELFRAKVASLGPSSEWGIRLARWNEKASDPDSIVFSSSDDDDDVDRPRPVLDTVRASAPLRKFKRRRVAVSDLQSSSPMVASVSVTSSSAPSDSRGLLNVELSVAPPTLSSPLPFPSFVEATSVTTSVLPDTPIMSSPIPVVPLFESLSSQTGTSNVFALSGSSSLPVQPTSPIDLPDPETGRTRARTAVGKNPPSVRRKKVSSRPPVSPSSGSRPSRPQPSGSRPPAPRSAPVSASSPSGSGTKQNFQEFVRDQFQDVAKVMFQHKTQFSKLQSEIELLKKRDIAREQQLAQLFRLSKAQSIQLGKFIAQEASMSARHQTLVSTTDRLIGVVTDLASLLAAQGESSSSDFQVQAQCKMDELKKIREDLDKDKDPNASKQGEQSRSTRAPEAATPAHVEGESSGAVTGGDKGPVEAVAEVILEPGEVAEGTFEDWRTDDDLAGKFSFIETAKGKSIQYESLPVNSDILRSYVFGVEMPEEIFNPLRVPEEVSAATRRWFRVLPDDTQRKRYLSTKGEYSGQIRSWDFDEQHGLVMIKRTDGVQYFRPRAKDLQTLPARDLHHIAQLDLNNHTNVAIIRGLIPHLVAESCESKWKLFKPAVGQGVKYLNKFTGKEEWKVVYPPSSCLREIPMRKFDLNKFDKIGYWYLNGKTGEAMITETNVAVEIAKILDPIWLANLREGHLKKLRRLPLKYNAEDRVLADQFIKVVQFCVKNKVWAGSVFSKRN
ncbi:hypothetical protein HanIR_Chr02g0094151 [Helianthus annuus]|nr:hypothetical protein HanIR_Chr02g0094151 [Helianthus annuus]